MLFETVQITTRRRSNFFWDSLGKRLIHFVSDSRVMNLDKIENVKIIYVAFFGYYITMDYTKLNIKYKIRSFFYSISSGD